ncbi:MAG: hypothetical protein ING33_01065 [Rhodocyclaceae bacterium]|nr:hypothetical protein [Rhodocyclaceae bacterium]MCA3023761.1 hypothetical protein [Rhodocyclaceae bacterium]MCA3033794.1 hypothetical protein [Rhodocyclaceae bacterium]MCA3035748.1 hypothetical protein [Rhodocyclaceae bacterium]MCA3045652.1 hypothetical protein [Rhodocyclaceae bacterium]
MGYTHFNRITIAYSSRKAAVRVIIAPVFRRYLRFMLAKFIDAVAFVPQGEAVANLRIGRGAVDGIRVHIAIIENRLASGAIGKAECDKLASLFRVVAAERSPLVLFIDSAGARVSEGLPALGAFRRMFAAAVAASLSGAKLATVLGTNCFGGASMLAALCGVRYFQPGTRLAMSGPSILASSAGATAIDESFRAIADVTIGTEGRIKLDASHQRFSGALTLPTMPAPLEVQAKLLARLPTSPNRSRVVERVERKDLALLYPKGYQLEETDGIVRGRAESGQDSVPTYLLGSIDKRGMTAARITQMTSDLIAMLASPRPAQIDLLFDCETHSTSLDDEKVMLSGYLANFSQVLYLLRAAGWRVQTVVMGKLGGGIYVALASMSDELNVIYGCEIQLLPSKAITAILGDNSASSFSFADYAAAGVAERELRIGVVQGV